MASYGASVTEGVQATDDNLTWSHLEAYLEMQTTQQIEEKDPIALEMDHLAQCLLQNKPVRSPVWKRPTGPPGKKSGSPPHRLKRSAL